MQVNHLNRVFKGKEDFVAVSDVTFELKSGEIMALLGPNGAGKTTTAKMLSGFLSPTSGEIVIDGENLAQKAKQLQKKISVVFGGEEGFYAAATAYDNLQFFANLFNVPGKIRKQKVLDVLSQVDLSDVADKKVGSFSRGMQQRLHIARGLLKDTNILLLDEPTNGLDVESAHAIRELVLQLKASGKAILLTSHLMNEVENLSDRITLIGSGVGHYFNNFDELYAYVEQETEVKANNLEEAYLAIAPSLRREV